MDKNLGKAVRSRTVVTASFWIRCLMIFGVEKAPRLTVRCETPHTASLVNGSHGSAASARVDVDVGSNSGGSSAYTCTGSQHDEQRVQ